MASLPGSQYPLDCRVSVPARSGRAIPLHGGQTIKITNIHGSQVVDFFAIMAATAGSGPDWVQLSMSHTRAFNLHLSPLPGDMLVDAYRVPMLQFIEDTTPSGIHDTLIAACDSQRYRQLGVPEDTYHDNCADNFREALKRDMNVEWHGPPPDPLNLFMNIPVHARSTRMKSLEESRSDASGLTAGAGLSFEAPVCRPGDHVRMKALVDCIVVMSACPQDIVKINNLEPTDAEFTIETT